MKKTIPCLFVLSAALSFFTTGAIAQTDKIATLSAPPKNIVIDGDIKEWGDSLSYYNPEKHINYALANSKDTLYMAVKFTDRVDLLRILRSGLTFTIDTKGKKKESFSISFPVNVQGGTTLGNLQKDDAPTDINQQDRDELTRERLTSLRGIKVSGFKDIDYDMITTSNTYGFQTAVNYDLNGNLVCEAAIPMAFFHADAGAKNEWAFNFKINGVQRKPQAEGSGQESEGGRGSRSGGGGGMGGGGGRHGGRGGNRSQSAGGGDMGEMGKSTDFWVKYYLAR